MSAHMNQDNAFYAIDLFAGCGGLGEGFKQAGFEVIADIEMDKWACQTLRTRHLFYGLKKRNGLQVYYDYVRGQRGIEDIFADYPEIESAISKRVIEAKLGEASMASVLLSIETSLKHHGAKHFHVLLGGPPCQPYSLIGRARDPDRMENDDRHYLYRHYLEILTHLKPDFFVYENVPGLFSARAQGQRVFSKLLEDFTALNPAYVVTPPLLEVQEDPSSYILNSVNFGVPQKRKRLILIGYRSDLRELNPNISEVFKKIQLHGWKKAEHGFLTVKDAISDLPPLEPGTGSDAFYSPYGPGDNLRPYQKRMRNLSPGVLNHRARTHMSSDIERYKFFIEHHRNGHKRATLLDLKEHNSDLMPAHKHLDKFVDRFKVQWWDQPSSTVMAHIAKDGHYYIHPDVNQCRSFTVREAARCQSFPDNFKFEGPRTEQYRQVGNAVPPLLAFHVAEAIAKELKIVYGCEKQV